jgi:formimidoylglutamase
MAIDDPLWPRADQWLGRADPDPQVAVLGVPYSKASLTPSEAHLAPGAIRRRLERFSTFHGEWGIDFGTVRVVDLGDLPIEGLEPQPMITEVEEAVASRLPPVELALFLGGDNSITRPLVRAVSRGRLDRIGLVTFDAHHDVRALDRGPSNGTPVRGLLEDGLAGAAVVQFGIHSFANSAHYRRYCDERGIEVVTIADLEEGGVAETVADRLESLAARVDRIYVDVDLDVLDRAYAPACPGARPGGLQPRRLADAVRICGAHPKVVAFDFVEVDPNRDVDGLTLDAAATVLLAAVCGYRERT